MKDYSVLDELVADTEKLHRAIFDEGYTQGYMDGKAEAYNNPVPTQDAYNKGLEDAWECIKQLEQIADYQLPNKTLCDIFGDDYYYGKTNLIIRKYSASEAIAKIKEYEEKQNEPEITVGDEVNAPGFHNPVVVIALYDSTDLVKVMNAFGDTGVHLKINVTKTGRHFPEISEVFKAMQEVEE